jgi:hypothetical protein
MDHLRRRNKTAVASFADVYSNSNRVNPGNNS